MVKKTFHFNISLLFIISISSLFALPISALNTYNESIMKINTNFPKVHKFWIFEDDTLGTIADEDTYHMQFKAGIKYYFWAKVKVDTGTFVLSVNGPGGSDSDVEIWDSDTPNSEKKLVFDFTPSDSGEHEIMIATLLPNDVSSYTLYVNRSGFGGYWWMILIGVLILIFIIVLLVAILSSSKKRYRRKR